MVMAAGRKRDRDKNELSSNYVAAHNRVDAPIGTRSVYTRGHGNFVIKDGITRVRP